ncbi:MAG TPA: Tat pathway signal sequence domain protein, partial [Opitutaceae bacterium]
MPSHPLSRRDFVKSTAFAAAALQLPATMRGQAGGGGSGVSTTPAQPAVEVPPGGVALRWLEGRPALTTGATWGVPWPRGAMRPDQSFALSTAEGAGVAVQSWPLGYWPDGSLKWSAHAIGADAGRAETLVLAPGTSAAPAAAVSVRESGDAIEIDTGVVRCVVARTGRALIRSLVRDGREIARDGRLVCLRQDRVEPDADGVVRQEPFTGEIEAVEVEQRGPIRAVVKLTGRHANEAGRAWLPFTIRLYFYAGGEAVRMTHTFLYDGVDGQDFIRGLGVRFAVPLRDAPHDRHVRFAGEGPGVWGEGVRNLTGLRRDPGEAVTSAQVAGRACPPIAEFPENVRKRLELIPVWGDYTLAQLSADGFQIRKRTKPGHGWIDADGGRRAAGLGYIGGATGGVAFGLRNFWQLHPTQLDIRGANTEAAEVTVWLWSPDAPAMDIRFYHDGMGMDTHAGELEGLEITYEDYEKGWGSPYGVGRSSELTLWALAATPPRERFAALADALRTPPQPACLPPRFTEAKVFGPLWSLPDRSTPAKAAIEDRLDWQFAFYKGQVEQRRWYGFWNYGDVMHTYDADRHVWRYDVGGFAWDNSELSPDLWLWYSFLRTGRADIFRFGEAMVRHTTDVDVHHIGRFAGLGSRHNVQHWGCSAKQVRISTSAYRRFYYFLTADERVGDVMRETLDADHKTADVDPVRKLPGQVPKDYPARVSVGTDWCSFAINWLTEWERTGGGKYRDKLLIGMKDIGAARYGFFSGDRFGYDPETGHLYNVLGDKVHASHLSAVFGALETCAELIQLVDDPAFERAWLQYCELYNATEAEQRKALGGQRHGGGDVLRTGHSRLTAYAAWRKRDPALAARAWTEFYQGEARRGRQPALELRRIEGPAVLNPVDEARWVSTNGAAQWGLAAIQNLALV